MYSFEPGFTRRARLPSPTTRYFRRTAIAPRFAHSAQWKAALCGPNGAAVFALLGHPLPMHAPAHAIAEAPGGSTDDRFEIVTYFENQDGPCSTYLCGDLANFVDTASRAVQIT